MQPQPPQEVLRICEPSRDVAQQCRCCRNSWSGACFEPNLRLADMIRVHRECEVRRRRSDATLRRAEPSRAEHLRVLPCMRNRVCRSRRASPPLAVRRGSVWLRRRTQSEQVYEFAVPADVKPAEILVMEQTSHIDYVLFFGQVKLPLSVHV